LITGKLISKAHEKSWAAVCQMEKITSLVALFDSQHYFFGAAPVCCF
jgi:hypothetical protein